MTNLKIEGHIKRFSGVVDGVLENGRDLLSSEGANTSLASIAFARNELSQLRDQLAQPSREFLGRTVIEHDYQALNRYLSANSIIGAIDSIDVSEFGRITQIAQYSGSYASLSGIELLTELRHLILHGVKVADCSALSELPQLESLNMIGNIDLDLSTLGAMNALEDLNCDDSLVGDHSWFSRCPNIRILSAEFCDIYSLESLSSCRALEELQISRNPLQSLAGIEKLSGLRNLRIENTQITDYSPLTLLPSLRELRVSEDMTILPSFKKCLRALHKKGVAVTKVNEDSSTETI